jgi:hypothetical protein
MRSHDVILPPLPPADLHTLSAATVGATLCTIAPLDLPMGTKALICRFQRRPTFRDPVRHWVLKDAIMRAVQPGNQPILSNIVPIYPFEN